jgi:hypothetical protein
MSDMLLMDTEIKESVVAPDIPFDVGIARKKDQMKILRQAGFILVSLILRWVVWGILGALRIFKVFDYLFLVYPGSPRDLDGYCPRKLARSWFFSKKPTVGGIVSKGQVGVRGLYCVVPNTAREFNERPDVCKEVKDRLVWLNNLVGARAVAVAGQVPGIMARNGAPIEKPFVRGNKGTVFCIMETVSEVAKRHNLNPAKTDIIVVGVGYVGGLLLDELRNEGYNAIGVDTELKKRDIVTLQEDSSLFLSRADIVIVLTPKGSDFVPYVRHLKKGAIVVDDTHPKITEKPQGVTFYKVAVGMRDVKFYPRLPGYKAEWIPGCAVEAIFSAATGKFNGSSQKDFNEEAKKLGFFAYLVN